MIEEAENKGTKDNEERIIFSSIRKPIAPPGRAFSGSQPDIRARPSLRKTKHKKRISIDDEI
jgi:hypothetical protein